MPAPAQPRYTATAQALHWLTALLLAAALPLAWVGTSLAREAPAKGPVFVLHKSVGLTILALVVVRILWRRFHPAPPELLPRGLALIGRINHGLLYAILLIMPVSGYLLSALAGRSTPYFWLFTIPGLTENRDLQPVFAGIHLAGQWAVYLLVALHLAGAAWHVAIRRDGLLDRMLPPQDRRLGP